LLALDSNLGDRAAQLNRALQHLSANPSIRVVARSRYHATRASGGPPDQADYLNAAVRCETERGPLELLSILQQVELDLGRVRTERWGPRTIDIDLLLYDGVEIASPALTLPHPRMAFRRFALGPAAEVAADMVHGPTGWSVRQLLERLDTAPPFIAAVGGDCFLRRQAVQRAGAILPCHVIVDPAGGVAEGKANDGMPAGDASWITDWPVKFLRRRAEALAILDQLPSTATAAEHVLTDFACVQSLAEANCCSTEVEREACEAEWRAVPPRRRHPKLLVLVVDDSAGGSEDAGQIRRAVDRELRRLVRRPFQCPVLEWRLAGSVSLSDEIVAACQAMQA
jgi:2-amino-4-hydroxy-6-hydroxymethyldihydropteridine diphosphokinase